MTNKRLINYFELAKRAGVKICENNGKRLQYEIKELTDDNILFERSDEDKEIINNRIKALRRQGTDLMRLKQVIQFFEKQDKEYIPIIPTIKA